MKLEQAKKLQNVFKSNLNKISRGRSKAEKQRMPLENIKLLYELREAVIKLFNDYSSVVSEAKNKTIYGKGTPSILTRIAPVAKVSHHSNLKILSPKQMLQRFPIALAQVKASNTSENLLNEIRQIIYSLYRAKRITGKVYNSIMNSIKL